jgi:hypothetical protein
MSSAPQDLQEPFEVFDATNESLGHTVPRGEVHARGLFHRSVQVLVYDALGRLGLQRRPHDKDVAPVRPGLLRGHCRAGLTPGCCGPHRRRGI